jgi:hypothetical protein
MPMAHNDKTPPERGLVLIDFWAAGLLDDALDQQPATVVGAEAL